MKRLFKNEIGITLIALVITIIVLIILAAVSIATLTGENGILTQATKANERTIHGDVREQLQLNVNEYSIDKNTEGSSSTLIEYLQSKQIIGNEIGEDTGNYQIDVTKLLGKAQKCGNGTATESEKKDVYMIEKLDEANGKVIYKVIYYKNGTSASEELGELTDVSNDEITFRITKFITDGDSASNYEDYNVEIMKDFRAKKGMTWREWYESSYCAKFIADFNSAFESIGCELSIDLESIYGQFPFVFTDRSTFGRGQHARIWDVGDAGIDIDDIIDPTKEYYIDSEWFSECVTPNSEIMIGKNKETKLAKDVEENDEIAYYDFSDNVVKIGTVSKVYIHRNATNFVKYIFEDGSYLEATDYHPIYTKEGWKSLTNRNGYETPQVGDEVKAEEGWKKLMKIETYTGKEDCYDFGITSEEGIKVDNYFANGTLVQGSY